MMLGDLASSPDSDWLRSSKPSSFSADAEDESKVLRQAQQSRGWANRREKLTEYFDQTARKAWEDLTSDAPVSRVRATVRAGRDRMRQIILSWLPADLSGLTLLDAGCGTGALAVEAARRGARVTAIDVSPRLISIAVSRAPDDVRSRLHFLSGDMLDPALGHFDHIVAMDSLIHYPRAVIADAALTLSGRAERSLILTVAPATPLLRAMYGAGKLFPRGDRSPAIVPVASARLRNAIGANGRDARVSSGFYISHAIEWTRT